MINLNITLTYGLVLTLLLLSCKKEDEHVLNDEFKIEFNDGKTITETDILFYDQSTHLIYLKSDLILNPNITDFNVSVGEDNIYNGIIYSCNLSSMPTSPYSIVDCFLYGNNILEIGYYGGSMDLRNDPRIIEAFENRHILRNGISCQIDKVEINSFEDYSQVICTITIKNHDNINYYILDPEKMGDLDFNYFTGGITLQNMETKLAHPLRWSVQSDTWSDITIEDLSILEKGSDMTFTFQSSDYYKMETGNYSARFRFCGVKQYTPDFNLNQQNGRIWVGQILSNIENIKVD